MKTGDLVLCKVGSFPLWPAMIVPLWFLNDKVKKKRQTGKIPVCFFNDTTYYWVNPTKVIKLTQQLIKATLNDDKLDNLIVKGAYNEAKLYSNDLVGFLTLKAEQEGRLEQFNKLLQTFGDNTNTIDIHKTIITNLDPLLEHPTISAKYTRTKANSLSKQVKKLPKRTIHSHVIINNKNTPTSNSETKHHHHHHKLDKSRNVEICHLLRRRLQSNLLQRDERPTVENIKESFLLLNKIIENLYGFFDLNCLQQSKLHKVVQLIHRDPQLEQFHSLCAQILQMWDRWIQILKTKNTNLINNNNNNNNNLNKLNTKDTI